MKPPCEFVIPAAFFRPNPRRAEQVEEALNWAASGKLDCKNGLCQMSPGNTARVSVLAAEVRRLQGIEKLVLDAHNRGKK